MTAKHPSRRAFLGSALALAGASRLPAKTVPVGLELYSVRESLKDDLMGTVAGVAKLGYDVVEFYSPYFEWTDAYAKQVRAHLDDLGIACRSLHSPAKAFAAEGRQRTVELNGILGSTCPVMASPGRRVEDADGWKRVAEDLTASQEVFAKAGMRAGYHNHGFEWRPVAGAGKARHAMDILADGTPEGVALQLDVGTCVHEGKDPVAWIKKHPGRIRSLHLKDWAPGEESDEKGYRVLFGEGVSPWKKIFAAAESVGGVEFYLIEQEGSRFSEMETAERCLQSFREIHG